MSSYLLDSDIIIWHLRGQKAVTEMLRDLQKLGVPACSALSVLEVQLGVKHYPIPQMKFHPLPTLKS
jgi:PIN domain nuclease of toxin-antitoxin system